MNTESYIKTELQKEIEGLKKEIDEKTKLINLLDEFDSVKSLNPDEIEYADGTNVDQITSYALLALLAMESDLDTNTIIKCTDRFIKAVKKAAVYKSTGKPVFEQDG